MCRGEPAKELLDPGARSRCWTFGGSVGLGGLLIDMLMMSGRSAAHLGSFEEQPRHMLGAQCADYSAVLASEPLSHLPLFASVGLISIEMSKAVNDIFCSPVILQISVTWIETVVQVDTTSF